MIKPEPDGVWDAGHLGCGELVVKLMLKFRKEFQPGDIIQLTARDAGAPEDIPAWCRLTNNPLVYQAHPDYYIQVKETP